MLYFYTIFPQVSKKLASFFDTWEAAVEFLHFLQAGRFLFETKRRNTGHKSG